MFHLESCAYYTYFQSDTFKVCHISGKLKNLILFCFHSNDYFSYFLIVVKVLVCTYDLKKFSHLKKFSPTHINICFYFQEQRNYFRLVVNFSWIEYCFCLFWHNFQQKAAQTTWIQSNSLLVTYMCDRQKNALRSYS